MIVGTRKKPSGCCNSRTAKTNLPEFKALVQRCKQSEAGNLSDCKSRRGEKSVNTEEELSVLKEKIEKMKETYKGAQDYEYENYKKYNEKGNTVAANRALGKSYAFEAIYTYIKNM